MVTKLSIRSALFGPSFRKTKIQTFFSDWYRMFSSLMSSITSYGKKIGHELQKYMMKCTPVPNVIKIKVHYYMYILYICTEYEDNSALSLETDTTELLGKTIDLQLSEVIFRVNNYTNENFFCRHCFFSSRLRY